MFLFLPLQFLFSGMTVFGSAVFIRSTSADKSLCRSVAGQFVEVKQRPSFLSPWLTGSCTIPSIAISIFRSFVIADSEDRGGLWRLGG